MSSIATRIRTCGLTFALVVLAAAPGIASAEDYLRGTYLNLTDKPDAAGAKTLAKGVQFDLRQDAQYLPLFVTFGFDGYRLRQATVPKTQDVTSKQWGGNVGFGYAYHPSAESELSARLQYTHLRADVEYAGLSGCCFNSDAGKLALGGYDWLNGWIKGYGELSYTSADHKRKGYAGKLGVEVAVLKSARVFGDYLYGKNDDDGSKSKVSGWEVGIKLPFGGKAGPDAVASGAVPAAPPAPKPVVGQTLKLKAGKQLHGAPKAEAGTVNAGDSITMQSSVTNAEGTWWYVSSGKDFGWALESDIETAPAPAPAETTPAPAK